jgi:hypothetical protein
MTDEQQKKLNKELLDEFMAAAVENEEVCDLTSPSGLLEGIERTALKTAVLAWQTWVACRGVSIAVRTATESER